MISSRSTRTDRFLRALVAGERVLLNRITRDILTLCDQFRATETVRSLIAITMQPALGFVGRRREPEMLAEAHADEIGIWLMFCMPPATDQVSGSDMIAWAPKDNGLLARTGTPVDGDTRHPLQVIAASHDSLEILPAGLRWRRHSLRSRRRQRRDRSRSVGSPRHPAAPRSRDLTNAASEPFRFPDRGCAQASRRCL